MSGPSCLRSMPAAGNGGAGIGRSERREKSTVASHETARSGVPQRGTLLAGQVALLGCGHAGQLPYEAPCHAPRWSRHRRESGCAVGLLALPQTGTVRGPCTDRGDGGRLPGAADHCLPSAGAGCVPDGGGEAWLPAPRRPAVRSVPDHCPTACRESSGWREPALAAWIAQVRVDRQRAAGAGWEGDFRTASRFALPHCTGGRSAPHNLTP